MWRFNFLQLVPANDNALPPRPALHRVTPRAGLTRWVVMTRAVDGRRVRMRAGQPRRAS